MTGEAWEGRSSLEVMVAGVAEVTVYAVRFLCMLHIYVHATGLNRGYRVGLTDGQGQGHPLLQKVYASALVSVRNAENEVQVLSHLRAWAQVPADRKPFISTTALPTFSELPLGPVIVIHWSSSML